MSKRWVSIYLLIDPRGKTNKERVRYVGKTQKLYVEERLRSHLKEAKLHPGKRSHRLDWIRSLQAVGSAPEIVLLGRFPVQDWIFWEQHFVLLYCRLGYSLVNSTDGGEGAGGNRWSRESKERLSKIVRTGWGNRRFIDLTPRRQRRVLEEALSEHRERGHVVALWYSLHAVRRRAASFHDLGLHQQNVIRKQALTEHKSRGFTTRSDYKRHGNCRTWHGMTQPGRNQILRKAYEEKLEREQRA